jgi:hypothetical protein
MTEDRDQQPQPAVCASPGCGATVSFDDGYCSRCGARVSLNRGNSIQISVQGANADEVAAVTRALSIDLAAHREAARLRSPWFSGLFYLTLLVVVVALLLVAGRVLALWAFPLVAAAAALLVAVVGALQLRQDDRLSERGFLRLMADVLHRLPLLLARGKSKDSQEPNST